MMLLSWAFMAGSAVAEGTEEAAGDGVVAELNADFNRELLTIEEQVNSLKERVFRSKATLQLLKEIVVQEALPAPGAR